MLNVSGGATVSVGGTLKQWSGTFTLNGGSITTQSYNRSGGTFNFQDGTFTVDGGTFIEPAAPTRYLVIQGNASGKTPTLVLNDLQNVPDYNGGIFIADAPDLNGALTLSGGTAITTASLLVGRNSGSVGALVLDGAGTSLTSLSTEIGGSGIGTLEVRNGASLTESSSSAYIGSSAGSNGTATVTGAGSSWTNASAIFRVGGAGAGVLNVLNGGLVTSFEARIASRAARMAPSRSMGRAAPGPTAPRFLSAMAAPARSTSRTRAASTAVAAVGAAGSVTVDGLGSTWANSGVLMA